MMEVMKALLVLLSALCLVVHADYAGFKMVRAHLDNEKQMAEVNKWQLDVWTRGSTLGIGWNDMVVNESHMDELLKMEVPFEVIIEDMVEHLAEGRRDLEQSRSHKREVDDFFTTYRTYAEINAYLSTLASQNPSIAKVAVVGASFEGRTINAINITGTATPTVPKKKIFVSGGQHAREWIAPATTLYILTQLVIKYGNDAAVTSLMDKTEFHFVPLVNPDGYNYTWTGDRLWKKNRRKTLLLTHGVDLNRNWDDHWCTRGSSPVLLTDTYCGTGPFSEPETKAVSDYITAKKPFAGAIDYHSYNQLILRPWGWTEQQPSNEADAARIGNAISTSIKAVNNVEYDSERAGLTLLAHSGGASDWFLSKGGIALSYTIELRDAGNGFTPSANQIEPTGEENWAGFLTFAQEATA